VAQEQTNPPPAAQPIDPAKLAAIEELPSLMKIDQLTQQMLTQVEQSMKPQIEAALPPEIQNSSRRSEMLADIQAFEGQIFGLIKDRLDFAELKPEYIKLYDETFSTEEVTGIVAFYKFPAGQVFVQKLPVLTSKSVEMGSRIMSGSVQQIQTMTAAWTESMKKKYGDSGAK
jgi:hypothetical protein